jgi:hypothetical protein
MLISVQKTPILITSGEASVAPEMVLPLTKN